MRHRLLRAVLASLWIAGASALVYSAATYPSSVKSFTTRVAGDTIQPAHINDLQDEVTAIETDALKAWTTPSYSAGDYTASSGTWTVDSGDVTTLAYHKIGKRMTVSFIIENTDVSATPTSLRITIPGGFTASKEMRAIVQAIDAAGTPAAGMAQVTASGTTINLFKDTSGAAWTATSSDNTTIRGQITFETTT